MIASRREFLKGMAARPRRSLPQSTAGHRRSREDDITGASTSSLPS